MSQKTVLITGCSSGFGYLTALQFARNGYYVFASVRNKENKGVYELTAIVKEQALPLEVIPIDVTEKTSIDHAISYVVKKQGRIDILINNAGYGYLGPIEDTPIDDIKELYETNIFGVLRMVKAVVPFMRRQHSGLIINLSSINGIVPFPLFSIYSSSKFAIETLTEGLRFELKPFGIHVTMVEPGSFLTSFSKNRRTAPGMNRKNSPYKRLIDHFLSRYTKTHRQNDSSILSKTANPQAVADLLYNIAQTPHPRMRYLVGGDAYKFYFIRKLLPTSIWEWLLHKTYQW